MAAVQRGKPDIAGLGDRLAGMDDVVDLGVVLVAHFLDESGRRLESMKAIDIHLADVPFGVAVGHPLGERLSDATGVGQPGTGRYPDALDRRRADDRHSIHRKREDPVDGLRIGSEVGVAQEREEGSGFVPRLAFEVRRGEWMDGVVSHLAGGNRAGGVPVAADSKRIPVLAEVDVRVQFARRRVDDLFLGNRGSNRSSSGSGPVRRYWCS